MTAIFVYVLSRPHVSEPTVIGEVARNLIGNAPIHQLTKQHVRVKARWDHHKSDESPMHLL